MQQSTTITVMFKVGSSAFKQAHALACPEEPIKAWDGSRLGSYFEVDTAAYENGQIEAPKKA